MRFIIREQEYERLIASGRLRYLSAGQETGASESWRLTQAVDGYRVMRVDLDRRETPVADSTLFHLLLDPQGQPDRLKLRQYSLGNESIEVDVLVDGGLLNVSRIVGGQTIRDEMSLPPGFALLMPATIGLALFVHGSRQSSAAEAINLDEQRNFSPSSCFVELQPLDMEELTVTGQSLAVRPYLIRRNGIQCKIWLDDYGMPLRLVRNDGAQIVEDRYMRHY